MEFQEIILFLQNLPTENWNIFHIETLLSQAFIYYTKYPPQT
jgi:hypothetical protein